MTRQSFPIAPLSATMALINIVIALIVVVLPFALPPPGKIAGGITAVTFLIIVGYTFYAASSVTFEVSEEGIRIRRSLYGRRIPKAHLEIERARIIVYAEEPRSGPFAHERLRRNRVRGGWFRLRSGEKALGSPPIPRRQSTSQRPKASPCS